MINNPEKNQSNVLSHTDSSHVAARDANVITVFEHQRLTAQDFVHVADFHWLLAQEFSVFTIKRKQGQWQLKVGHYVGIILLPSGMTLEILPKLGASPENPRSQRQQQSYKTAQNNDVSQTRQWVQQMLSDLTNSGGRTRHKLPHTKNLGQFSHQLASLPPAALPTLPLSDWLIAQFLQWLVHYQPTKHYQAQTQNQASLQGRLLIKEQLRHNSMQPHKFVCESSVLSQDMLGNRLIKSALVLLTPLVSKSSICHTLQAWQPVSTLTRHEMTQLELIYGQAKRHLAVQPLRAQQLQAGQQLVDLAYWLLQQSNVATGNGIDSHRSLKQNLPQLRLCLLIDMNQAFEQWASQRIASMFTQMSESYRPLYQTQRVWLSDTEGQACLSIRPDLLIYKVTTDKNCHHGQDNTKETSQVSASGSYSHVIDMKWKHLSQTAAISASDAYQLVSYAQAYQAGQVWLVYPVQGSDRQPVALKQRGYDYDNEHTDNQTGHAPLWLMPFNVLTGTINSGLLPAVNVV